MHVTPPLVFLSCYFPFSRVSKRSDLISVIAAMFSSPPKRPEGEGGNATVQWAAKKHRGSDIEERVNRGTFRQSSQIALSTRTQIRKGGGGALGYWGKQLYFVKHRHFNLVPSISNLQTRGVYQCPCFSALSEFVLELILERSEGKQQEVGEGTNCFWQLFFRAADEEIWRNTKKGKRGRGRLPSLPRLFLPFSLLQQSNN